MPADGVDAVTPEPLDVGFYNDAACVGSRAEAGGRRELVRRLAAAPSMAAAHERSDAKGARADPNARSLRPAYPGSKVAQAVVLVIRVAHLVRRLRLPAYRRGQPRGERPRARCVSTPKEPKSYCSIRNIIQIRGPVLSCPPHSLRERSAIVTAFRLRRAPPVRDCRYGWVAPDATTTILSRGTLPTKTSESFGEEVRVVIN